MLNLEFGAMDGVLADAGDTLRPPSTPAPRVDEIAATVARMIGIRSNGDGIERTEVDPKPVIEYLKNGPETVLRMARSFGEYGQLLKVLERRKTIGAFVLQDPDREAVVILFLDNKPKEENTGGVWAWLQWGYRDERYGGSDGILAFWKEFGSRGNPFPPHFDSFRTRWIAFSNGDSPYGEVRPIAVRSLRMLGSDKWREIFWEAVCCRPEQEAAVAVYTPLLQDLFPGKINEELWIADGNGGFRTHKKKRKLSFRTALGVYRMLGVGSLPPGTVVARILSPF